MSPHCSQYCGPEILAGVAAAALLAGPASGQCPPGTFDYGPARDPMIASVVVDHAGPSGPILPDPSEYARAERDIGLIRAAYPALAGVGHTTLYVQGRILIRAPLPFSTELTCANLYYAVALESLAFDFWLVRFPMHVNPEGMARVYRSLPGVILAELDLWGCAGFCCGSRWSYEPSPGGSWRWTVAQNQPVVGPCQSTAFEQVFVVTAPGAVLPACYANCDASTMPPVLNVNDFICFQARFAAADAYADCDETGTLNVGDFVCFQSRFAAGCL